MNVSHLSCAMGLAMMSCEPPSSPEAVFEGTQQPVPIGPVVDRGVEVAVFGLG